MGSVLDRKVTKEEKEEIKELVATLLVLPSEDRAVLLSNANALRVRKELERRRESERRTNDI